jgi:hypothetical protein
MQRPWCRVVGDASGRITKLTDKFDLERFVTAQEPVFDAALSELRAGRKRSHWMWFVFPQIRGLGSSSMAEYRVAGFVRTRKRCARLFSGVACHMKALQCWGRSIKREAICTGSARI